jgi:hypothetical protein
MSGRPDLRPLDAGSRYLLDREGVAYSVDDGGLRRLKPIPRFKAAQVARADFRFDTRDVRYMPRKEADPLVREGVTEWLRIPAQAERGPDTAHFVGQEVSAVGDTSSGWYALHLPDGSTQVFHGPSVAAHIFRRSV